MVTVKTLTVGPLATNCYLVYEEGARQCLVIDPGYEPETILTSLEKAQLTPAAILLTHGHFDHVGGVKKLVEATCAPVYLCALDTAMPHPLTAGPLYYTHTLEEGSVLSLAGLTLQVLHTPGHTPGSVCFVCQDVIFSGDTLFAGSCGRTDLPGGSWRTLMESLQRLARLEGDFRIFPGHGESTTLLGEKQYNPYM